MSLNEIRPKSIISYFSHFQNPEKGPKQLENALNYIEGSKDLRIQMLLAYISAKALEDSKNNNELKLKIFDGDDISAFSKRQDFKGIRCNFNDQHNTMEVARGISPQSLSNSLIHNFVHKYFVSVKEDRADLLHAFRGVITEDNKYYSNNLVKTFGSNLLTSLNLNKNRCGLYENNDQNDISKAEELCAQVFETLLFKDKWLKILPNEITNKIFIKNDSMIKFIDKRMMPKMAKYLIQEGRYLNLNISLEIKQELRKQLSIQKISEGNIVKPKDRNLNMI